MFYKAAIYAISGWRFYFVEREIVWTLFSLRNTANPRNCRRYQKVKSRIFAANMEAQDRRWFQFVLIFDIDKQSLSRLSDLFIFLPATSVHLILPAEAICSITCKIFRVHFQLRIFWRAFFRQVNRVYTDEACIIFNI